MARIPASIEHNHTIRTNQIDSQRTSARRHQEQVYFRIDIELIDKFLALLRSSRSIQAYAHKKKPSW